ncbi:MAG: helix-hairpin-helix domain-containing protein [Candidatus Nitrosocosmicus sp.]|nr:helix-hairpin-helix domain-containing protein [Candidatus Nitrosocosmicus sp.]
MNESDLRVLIFIPTSKNTQLPKQNDEKINEYPRMSHNVKLANVEISDMLRKISFLLELDNEIDNNKTNLNFKNRAYIRAADQIDNLPLSITSLYEERGINGLLQIPSIGKAISSKIEEYIKTGKIEYYEILKSKYPIKVDDFVGLEGIGPKTLRAIIDKLPVRSLSDLEKAAREGKLNGISGISKKKEERILKRIELHNIGKKRHLLGDIYPLVKQIEKYLTNLENVSIVTAVGSFRRMRETVGDIDFLVVSDNPDKVINSFVNMHEVKEIISKGSTKAFIKLNNGLDSDLLVVPKESYGAALQYFTGSKEHGIALRRIAQSNALRLNEWGLFDNKSDQKISGESEEQLYNKLGLEWIPPELRENRGEIEIAKKGSKEWQEKMKGLLKYGDIKGDLQVHSNSTDGKMSIEEMAYFARTNFDLDYIAITDHTKSLRIARGLDEQQLLDQAHKIQEFNDSIKSGTFFVDLNKHDEEKQVNRKTSNNERIKGDKNLGDFRILSSAEVNILSDGSLDIPNNILDKLDIVGAAIHTNFSQPIEVQTNRLIKAAQNPSVDIIFHPTGRIINKRDGYPVDIPKLMTIAKETNTILEIDSHYNRLDLRDDYIRMAIQNDVKLVVDSDAHHPLHYAFLEFGIGQARRGWAGRNDILNTLPVSELLKKLK